YALLAIELQAEEAREALAREKVWARVAKTSRSKELNGTTLPESRVPEELAPLQLVVEADSADAPHVALVNVTGQVSGEVDLQNTESSWIIPLVPAASTGESIRHRLVELENRIANSQVLSPVDGVVASTSMKEGVPSVIILARQPELIVTIPISEANNVEQGAPFPFTSIAGSEPGSAVVYAIVPDDTDKDRARVLARVENAKPLQVSGLTAIASLPMKVQRVTSLPTNALLRDSKSARVLLLVNGVQREMEVNILNESDGQVTIAESLESGDSVVLNPL
ncbi:MAG: hypothetical protein K8S54_10600, partial [Spirochaetia bacterium]|nr:hypothetical protein [Spirochaetia bacterium]